MGACESSAGSPRDVGLGATVCLRCPSNGPRRAVERGEDVVRPLAGSEPRMADDAERLEALVQAFGDALERSRQLIAVSVDLHAQTRELQLRARKARRRSTARRDARNEVASGANRVRQTCVRAVGSNVWRTRSGPDRGPANDVVACARANRSVVFRRGTPRADESSRLQPPDRGP